MDVYQTITYYYKNYTKYNIRKNKANKIYLYGFYNFT